MNLDSKAMKSTSGILIEFRAVAKTAGHPVSLNSMKTLSSLIIASSTLMSHLPSS